jgi:type IX secretion system PorP/SprF family membrane protein
LHNNFIDIDILKKISGMILLRRLSASVLMVFIFSVNVTVGQQVPLNPISYRIFSPFIFNPAIAGCKDYSSIELTGSFQESSSSQILSGNSRLTKRISGYFLSPDLKEFSNLGIGGYAFNDRSDSSRNLGVGATLSYHIPLNKKHLSFLSFGAAVKGVKFNRDSVHSTDPGLSQPSKDVSYSNVDLGIYYYSPTFFAGISMTNILGNPEEADITGKYDIPVSQQFFFQAGYKILLSRSLNIVLEPSLIINDDGSSSQEVKNMLEPMLRFYFENFCLGSYFNDLDKMSFFLQYKYPRFYFGAFFQLPKNSPYFKQPMVAELTLGINFIKMAGFNHW